MQRQQNELEERYKRLKIKYLEMDQKVIDQNSSQETLKIKDNRTGYSFQRNKILNDEQTNFNAHNQNLHQQPVVNCHICLTCLKDKQKRNRSKQNKAKKTEDLNKDSNVIDLSQINDSEFKGLIHYHQKRQKDLQSILKYSKFISNEEPNQKQTEKQSEFCFEKRQNDFQEPLKESRKQVENTKELIREIKPSKKVSIELEREKHSQTLPSNMFENKPESIFKVQKEQAKENENSLTFFKTQESVQQPKKSQEFELQNNTIRTEFNLKSNTEHQLQKEQQISQTPQLNQNISLFSNTQQEPHRSNVSLFNNQSFSQTNTEQQKNDTVEETKNQSIFSFTNNQQGANQKSLFGNSQTNNLFGQGFGDTEKPQSIFNVNQQPEQTNIKPKEVPQAKPQLFASVPEKNDNISMSLFQNNQNPTAQNQPQTQTNLMQSPQSNQKNNNPFIQKDSVPAQIPGVQSIQEMASNSQRLNMFSGNKLPQQSSLFPTGDMNMNQNSLNKFTMFGANQNQG